MTSATPKPRAGEHVPGPWRGGKCRLHFEGGREVWAVFANGQTPICTLPEIEEAEANARRIIICVNACEAMGDPDAEIADVMENVRLLRIERDALCEVLGQLADASEQEGEQRFRAALGKARALLAKHGR